MSWTCQGCDTVFEDEVEHHEYGGDRYCDSCIDTDFSNCDRCGCMVHNDDGVYVDDEGATWCQSCAEGYTICCDRCERVVSEYTDVAGGDSVCQRCLEEAYCFCDGCERYYHGDYMRYDEEEGEYYCESCSEDRESERPVMHDHSYRPSPRFFKSDKDKDKHPLYFGVEVEMEAKSRYRPSDVIRSIAEDDAHGMWYCKRDGSLSSQGIELVSHPFTFNWMREHPDGFASLFNRRGECLSYNTTSCGMHVHMSIRAFSGLHLFKFASLFFQNPSFILLISRRHPDRMNQWSACDLQDTQLSKIAAKKAKNPYRYCALNFLPANTVECRVFRGTLSPPGFYGNIEFLHGLYHFSKLVGVKDITVPKFCIYMRDNLKMYPNFAAALGNKLPMSMEGRK